MLNRQKTKNAAKTYNIDEISEIIIDNIYYKIQYKSI